MFSFNSSTKEYTGKSVAKLNCEALLQQSLASSTKAMQADFLNAKVVNDLIYNECSSVVTLFKDYLILDDINEFLKRGYTRPESLQRLPMFCAWYDTYS